MSRNVKMILYLLGIVAWMGLMSLVAYQAGSVLAKSIVGTTGTLTVQKWQIPYKPLVMTMGSISALVAIAWCALSEWGFSVNAPLGVGKRTIWAIFGAVLTVLSFAVPYIYAGQKPALLMSPMIPLLFVLVFVLGGYWLSTLFGTSDAYKYTPIGGTQLRRRKGGKN